MYKRQAEESSKPTSPSPLAEGDYMADEDFNMLISSSAAASSTMPSVWVPTTNPTVLQRAYESDPEDDFDVAYMFVKTAESTPAAPAAALPTEGEDIPLDDW